MLKYPRSKWGFSTLFFSRVMILASAHPTGTSQLTPRPPDLLPIGCLFRSRFPTWACEILQREELYSLRAPALCKSNESTVGMSTNVNGVSIGSKSNRHRPRCKKTMLHGKEDVQYRLFFAFLVGASVEDRWKRRGDEVWQIKEVTVRWPFACSHLPLCSSPRLSCITLCTCTSPSKDTPLVETVRREVVIDLIDRES